MLSRYLCAGLLAVGALAQLPEPAPSPATNTFDPTASPSSGALAYPCSLGCTYCGFVALDSGLITTDQLTSITTAYSSANDSLLVCTQEDPVDGVVCEGLRVLCDCRGQCVNEPQYNYIGVCAEPCVIGSACGASASPAAGGGGSAGGLGPWTTTVTATPGVVPAARRARLIF